MTPRARVTHKVKCWPEFFQPMLNALKRFDLRRDDRPELLPSEIALLPQVPAPQSFNLSDILRHFVRIVKKIMAEKILEGGVGQLLV